jgi:hypothetical protein
LKPNVLMLARNARPGVLVKLSCLFLLVVFVFEKRHCSLVSQRDGRLAFACPLLGRRRSLVDLLVHFSLDFFNLVLGGLSDLGGLVLSSLSSSEGLLLGCVSRFDGLLLEFLNLGLAREQSGDCTLRSS